VPDGTYEAETGYLDDDGKNRGVLLPVKVKVIVEGDELTIDVTGSSGEVETAFNSPYEGAVVSAATYIVRTIFLDEATYDVFVPQNEGMLRPVRVIAPKGSIFNPTFPRATKARFCQVQRMADFTLQALAPVIPEKVTAGNSASTTFLSYSGFQPETDEYWIYLEVNEGSHGGRFGKDGWDSVDSLIANTRNNPIEELEWRFPMRTERYELRDVYAAPGKWRGGIGIVRVNRFLVDTIIACEGDRFFGDPPWGIFGGHPGRTATLRKNPDTPDEESWPSKFTNQRLLAGDAIEITVPNSGGYGDPVERDPRLVLDDVLDGFASIEQAVEIYRVAIDPETLTLDLKATEALRAGVEAVAYGSPS
jgi:5-oxoprolinase (ATP-hydrolysing)